MSKAHKPPTLTCGIFLYSTQNRKFLACHATNSPWNKWSIPKGLKDEGEESLEAAARELKEETGIDLETLTILELYPLPPVKYKKQNKMLVPFLIVTDTPLESYPFECQTFVKEKSPEIDSWKWISLAEIPNYLHESQRENLHLISSLLEQYYETGLSF